MAANFDNKRYLQDGWALFSANIKPFSIAGFICFVIVGIGMIVPPIPIIAGGLLIGGIFILIMNAAEGEELDIKQMGELPKILWPLLFMGVISHILIGIGFFVLIVPGIFLWGCYMFSYLIFLDKGIDFWSAMEQSRKFGFENRKDILILALIISAINLLGAIPFGLGLIVTIPLTACIVAEAYDGLFGFESIIKAPKKTESDEPKEITDNSGYTTGQFARISIFVEKANPSQIFVQKVIGKMAPASFRQNPPPVISGHGLDNWPDGNEDLERLIKTAIANAEGDDVAHDGLHKMVLKKAADSGTKKRMAAAFFIVN